MKDERGILLRRCYGGSMDDRLSLALAWYDRHGHTLRQHADIRRQLELLAHAAATLSAHMAAIGLNDLCAACAARPNGGCCSAAIGDDCDAPLLLMNLLLGVDIVCQDDDTASCRFLGAVGCPFVAKPIFCLNYNCDKILRHVREGDMGLLYWMVGEVLGEQGRVEGLLLDFLRGNMNEGWEVYPPPCKPAQSRFIKHGASSHSETRHGETNMKKKEETKSVTDFAKEVCEILDRFYAHSTDRPDRSDWQLLNSHLSSVAKLAADFAKVFNAAGLAHIAGQLHDLGKYAQEVQRRIVGENIRAEHAIQGAQLALQRYGEKLGTLLAYIIAGHHAGLANGRDSETRSSLKERLARSGVPELLPAWQTEVSLPAQCSLPQGFKLHPDATLATFQLAFLVRMLYSCLVDADFLDTEAFYDSVENRPLLRDSGPPLTTLQLELNKTLSTFKADSEVNRLRADILRHVREQATLAPGLFSLTVPTGGGKTLTSLAFALDHALAHQPTHGFRRIIYAIPFTSIIEQNAAEFRKALGELGKAAVLEHHSAFDDSKLKDQNSRDKLRRAAENWDRPVVVTTAVQFFESLFADRSSRCRKLHNIAGSVIILDEAQTLPLKLLRPCVAAIDELARNYRCSIVLCTATQPALNANQDNPAEGFRNGLTNVRELAPEPKHLYRQLERVRVTHIGEQDDEALAKRLKENPQVLCIVNNRRHARALFDAIRDEPGARHLSTFMCARHRSQVLDAIRDDLLPKNNRPCRLISTSLIEAGVDIDFPYVLRAEAGLDSIAQAAGRCNREGRRAREDSLVHIFHTDTWAPPSELKQFAQAMRLTLGHHAENPLSLDAIEAYFRELYWQKGDEALDARNILGLIKNGGIDGMPFETVAAQFRMIDNVQHPIIVPFKASDEQESPVKALLDELRFVNSPGVIARALQLYTVQVPESAFYALRNVGSVQPVEEQRFGEQFMELVNDSLYNTQVGLLWEDPTFVAAEKLVW